MQFAARGVFVGFENDTETLDSESENRAKPLMYGGSAQVVGAAVVGDALGIPVTGLLVGDPLDGLLVGDPVWGATVAGFAVTGEFVGVRDEGDAVGWAVPNVGLFVAGLAVGQTVGLLVAGLAVGQTVGQTVGLLVAGLAVGQTVGQTVG